MNRLSLAVVTAACLATDVALAADKGADEAAIRELQVRQADAWNRHDAKAYAALFTPDGDVVNIVGWWWKGPAEIERKLAAAYAFAFQESAMTVTSVDVRFLTPDVAVAHVLWTMTGARTPPGVPEPKQGIQLQVLHRHAGQWRIASFQNTLAVPEVAFPAGPPPAR